jgi:PII-like signaling protein
VKVGKRSDLEMRAKMLNIYIGQDDEWEDKPLYEAIVVKLRQMGVAGDTVRHGIMGYGARQHMPKSGLLGISLPILITTADNYEKLEVAIPALDEMVKAGLIALSDVEVIKYTPRSLQ